MIHFLAPSYHTARQNPLCPICGRCLCGNSKPLKPNTVQGPRRCCCTERKSVGIWPAALGDDRRTYRKTDRTPPPHPHSFKYVHTPTPGGRERSLPSQTERTGIFSIFYAVLLRPSIIASVPHGFWSLVWFCCHGNDLCLA